MNIPGAVIRVDSEDVARIQSQSWSVQDIDGKLRVRATVFKKGRPVRLSLERFIMEARPGFLVIRSKGSKKNDFRKCVLILCSMQERQSKLPKSRRKCSSKYKGVSRSLKSNLWRASIRPNGRSIFLGEFSSEIEAALAYNAAALHHFGQGCFLNVIAEDT